MDIIEVIVSILIFYIFSLFVEAIGRKSTLRKKWKYGAKRRFENKLESGYIGEQKFLICYHTYRRMIIL